MRVGIDAHMLGERETGNETYCRGLLEGLAQLKNGHEYVAYLNSASELTTLASFGKFECRVLKRESSVWRLTIGFARSVREDGLDLLHVSYNAPVYVSTPLVVSVHDISFEYFPEFFSKRDLHLLTRSVPFSVKRAGHIITLSESAASDIERVYRVERGKISVIPLAARTCFRPVDDAALIDETCKLLGIEAPYVLAVGNLQPRKNLPRLIEAFSRLPRSMSDLKLVLVGRARWRESQVYERVNELGLKDRVVFTGYVSDEQLAALYSQSLASVYPSLYEGFGLPILEAMACGSPVICSNTSSMPEVAGDAALLITPTDTAAIADALRLVVEEKSLRDSLRARGLERAASFSWADTARETVRVYEEVVSGGRQAPVVARLRRTGEGDAC